MMSVRRLSVPLALALAAFAATGCQSAAETGLAAYERGEFDVAVARWRPAAEQGDANAQFLIGLSHDLGQGVDRDALAAASWYGKAAAQDHALAMNNLALLYHRGDGVPRSGELAAFWFERAAAGGYAPAHTNLAQVVPHGDAVRSFDLATRHAGRDPAAATVLLERAASLGHPEAQFLVGWQTFHGQGTPRDPARAVAWFERAAERGQPAAQTQLALCLLRGEGTRTDGAAAVRWLQRAAAQGFPLAHHNLALLQMRGEHTAQNRIEAHARFTLAAAGGVDQAQTLLDQLGATLSGPQLVASGRRAQILGSTATPAAPVR